MSTTKGYKVFDRKWQCRGYQYRVGETAVMEGAPVICGRGFHFCKRAVDCLSYYSLNRENKYAEVEAGETVEYTLPSVDFSDPGKADFRASGNGTFSSGNSVTDNGNFEAGLEISGKCATNSLRVVRELSYEEFRARCSGERTSESPEAIETVTMVNGVNHGPYAYRQRDGRSKSGSYKSGKHHGPHVEWHPNGNKQAEYTVNVGKRHGMCVEWYETGEIMSRRIYDAGKQHGHSIEYYKNGVESKRAAMVHGMIQHVVYRNEKGKVSRSYEGLLD